MPLDDHRAWRHAQHIEGVGRLSQPGGGGRPGLDNDSRAAAQLMTMGSVTRAADMQMASQDDVDATASQRLSLRVASGIERMMRHENPDVLRPELLHVSADAVSYTHL